MLLGMKQKGMNRERRDEKCGYDLRNHNGEWRTGQLQ